MKRSLFVLILLFSGCGYESRYNESIGQVKKVIYKTPLICINYKETDISLGVMVNGVGSMSTQDEWYYVPNETDFLTLKRANESAQLVKITYSVRRVVFCVPNHVIEHVEILKN